MNLSEKSMEGVTRICLMWYNCDENDWEKGEIV